MTTYEATAQRPQVLDTIYRQYDLTEVGPMSGGEMGTALVVAVDSYGVRRVIKTADNPQAATEVEDNIHGYRSIAEAGGASILPPQMMDGHSDGVPYLVMPDLGADFTRTTRNGQSDYPVFFKAVDKLCSDTVCEEPGAQLAGLTEFGDHIAKWYGKLHGAGMIRDEDLRLLAGIDLSTLVSDRASLMLLDFTPDNVFINDGEAAFIDPWRQGTYVGSLIPSVSQFMTLATEVYKLPGAAENTHEFERYLLLLGDKLGLDKSQVAKQASMGRALQLALSSYVRIGSDPVMSKHFADKSTESLKIIQEGN